MRQLRYTLTSDGPSDRSLMAVINWTLKQSEQLTDIVFLPQFADHRDSKIQSHQLLDRVRDAVQRFPCDILFVHRDAERESREKRQDEIDQAVSALAHSTPRWVPLIPVRMTEAWLLINEQAIRQAADNPNGSVELDLPNVSRLETLPDPKEILNELLIRASEKTGRRLAKFTRPSELAWRRGRVGELIEDYSLLQSLDAFTTFEEQFNHVMNQQLATE